jgi:hypothetical protein
VLSSFDLYLVGVNRCFDASHSRNLDQRTLCAPYPNVLIKSYGGSRLYLDLCVARRLAEMLLRGRRFIIRDTETGEDVTRDILDRLH